MLSVRKRLDPAMWSPHLVLLLVSVFLINFGQGLFQGASTNYFVETLGLSSTHVMWLQGIREIPGLLLILIAALMMRWPLAWRAAVSVFLMGLGYGLYATVNSYLALVAVALVASLGFHLWTPLEPSLGMALVRKEYSGRVMGTMAASRSLAIILGMGGLSLLSGLVHSLSLRFYFIVGGSLVMIGALLISRLPKNLGVPTHHQQRILVKWRYWRYYALTLFEGVRAQVFGAFGTLVLVKNFGLEVWQISLILMVSGIVNFFVAPLIGKLIDRIGERAVLTIGYTLMALCFAAYATLSNPWLLSGALVLINMLLLCSMGLSTYVNRIAAPEELTPTLSAGVSFNHITSVSMSFVAGTLLGLYGYQTVAWGAVAVVLLSIPFALSIRVKSRPAPKEQALPTA